MKTPGESTSDALVLVKDEDSRHDATHQFVEMTGASRKTGRANIAKVSMFKRPTARRLVRYHLLIWTADVEDSELEIWTPPCGVFEAKSELILSRGRRAKISANVS